MATELPKKLHVANTRNSCSAREAQANGLYRSDVRGTRSVAATTAKLSSV